MYQLEAIVTINDEEVVSRPRFKNLAIARKGIAYAKAHLHLQCYRLIEVSSGRTVEKWFSEKEMGLC